MSDLSVRQSLSVIENEIKEEVYKNNIKLIKCSIVSTKKVSKRDSLQARLIYFDDKDDITVTLTTEIYYHKEVNVFFFSYDIEVRDDNERYNKLKLNHFLNNIHITKDSNYLIINYFSNKIIEDFFKVYKKYKVKALLNNDIIIGGLLNYHFDIDNRYFKRSKIEN